MGKAAEQTVSGTAEPSLPKRGIGMGTLHLVVRHDPVEAISGIRRKPPLARQAGLIATAMVADEGVIALGRGGC